MSLSMAALTKLLFDGGVLAFTDVLILLGCMNLISGCIGKYLSTQTNCTSSYLDVDFTPVAQNMVIFLHYNCQGRCLFTADLSAQQIVEVDYPITWFIFLFIDI